MGPTLLSSVRGRFSGDMVVATKTILDLEEWDLVLAKLHRYHADIQQECGIIVKTIKAEMKSDLIPLAEEKRSKNFCLINCSLFLLVKYPCVLVKKRKLALVEKKKKKKKKTPPRGKKKKKKKKKK